MCCMLFFSWLANFFDGFHDIAKYIIKRKTFHQDKDHFGLWMLEVIVISKLFFVT